MKRVCLGQITGAHGVRGEVRIKAYTETPDAVADYGLLSDRTGARVFRLLGSRVSKGGLVARIEGVSDRDSAEALKGVELYVDRDVLPEETDEESWYHADLIGLMARHRDGTPIGPVVAVQNYGAGDLLEIELAAGGTTVLVPFTETIVPAIDIAGGWLQIDAPEGLLD